MMENNSSGFSLQIWLNCKINNYLKVAQEMDDVDSSRFILSFMRFFSLSPNCAPVQILSTVFQQFNNAQTAAVMKPVEH